MEGLLFGGSKPINPVSWNGPVPSASPKPERPENQSTGIPEKSIKDRGPARETAQSWQRYLLEAPSFGVAKAAIVAFCRSGKNRSVNEDRIAMLLGAAAQLVQDPPKDLTQAECNKRFRAVVQGTALASRDVEWCVGVLKKEQWRLNDRLVAEALQDVFATIENPGSPSEFVRWMEDHFPKPVIAELRKLLPGAGSSPETKAAVTESSLPPSATHQTSRPKPETKLNGSPQPQGAAARPDTKRSSDPDEPEGQAGQAAYFAIGALLEAKAKNTELREEIQQKLTRLDNLKKAQTDNSRRDDIIRGVTLGILQALRPDYSAFSAALGELRRKNANTTALEDEIAGHAVAFLDEDPWAASESGVAESAKKIVKTLGLAEADAIRHVRANKANYAAIAAGEPQRVNQLDAPLSGASDSVSSDSDLPEEASPKRPAESKRELTREYKMLAKAYVESLFEGPIFQPIRIQRKDMVKHDAELFGKLLAIKVMRQDVVAVIETVGDALTEDADGADDADDADGASEDWIKSFLGGYGGMLKKQDTAAFEEVKQYFERLIAKARDEVRSELEQMKQYFNGSPSEAS